ncbi:ABC transporter substrate-binding protein [Clostridium felsineum]|uniref:Arabinose-binding protein n=1 Tax=Clostridium felsineum TaxID=36839 RepID=A0A1S8LLF3_9CLOT|nr:ABC transporter substrate-binding protein [Clostridium felsineum]MCR3758342.1 ABC transporter substrate-binding protein [Clostridium felsineum]URZ03695.1 putative arabinose-binding protein [Clostridium felsineum]URZ07992.1 putative arabinose-binding protein [Clostridium felsineum]URZ13023.1 putative arabinose-binding protein [Clostridium felsineum]
MKRFFKSFLFVVMSSSIIFYASACGTSKNTNAIKSNQNTTQKKVSITIWINSKDQNIIKDQINDFNKKYDYITVNPVFMTEEDIMKNYESNVKNKSKLPDVVEIGDLNASSFIDKFNQKLVNMSSDSDIKSDMFLSNKVHNLTNEGKVYGYPWYTEPLFMFYRSDILNSLNVKPEDIKTWQEYNELGNAVKQNGKNLTYISDLSDIYNVQNTELGVNFLDSNNKVNIKNDKFKEASSFLFDIIKGNTNISVEPGKDTPKAFASGEIVSMMASPEEILYLENNYPNLKGKVSVQRLPAFEQAGNNTAYRGGENFLVTDNTKNKSYASVFAKFVTSDEEAAYKQFAIYALCSSNASVYTYDKIHKKNDYIGGYDVYEMYMNAAKMFSDIKYYKNYEEIDDYIVKEIGNEAAQNKNIDEIIENIQKNLDDKYNK